MSCCNECATGGQCNCTSSGCAPYSGRALEALRRDRDVSTTATLAPGVVTTVFPPSRGGAVFDYSCATFTVKNDAPTVVPDADITGIRWRHTIDPTGSAAVQEGLTERSRTDFICGDECKYFEVEATVIGDSSIETLGLDFNNSNAAAATVTLQIQGRKLCVPTFSPLPV